MMLSTMDIISFEESRIEFGNSMYVPEEGGKMSASTAGVNEAARKYCRTLPVCNLAHTVIKTIEGKQTSLFQLSLIRTIKKVY